MLEHLLKPEMRELIQQRDFTSLRVVLEDWEAYEIAALVDALPPPEDLVIFRVLPRDRAARTFELLPNEMQRKLVEELARDQPFLAKLLNDLSPDDRTALFGELPGPITHELLKLLTPEERAVATTLLGYPPESVGRLMTTDYVEVRPEWTVQQALDHIRHNGKDSETLNVIYVVDEKMSLVDDLRIREVLLADPAAHIGDLIDRRYVCLTATDDREAAVQAFRIHDRTALPVTDTNGVFIGIVTVDDVLDVLQEEATEDIQKLGGTQALEAPYLDTPFFSLIKKRAGWLTVLFLGEMLTASVMQKFEFEIAQAVVLALFLPLIISSGGNSGSQAATLIIRSLAVSEVKLADWWRVMRREIFSGLVLGSILGIVGVLRIALWQQFFHLYGPHWPLIAFTVGTALVGVVIWGTLCGSMLPFLLRRLGADPAVSSAPLVATLIDVTGLIIYFTMAGILLKGTLL